MALLDLMISRGNKACSVASSGSHEQSVLAFRLSQRSVTHRARHVKTGVLAVLISERPFVFIMGIARIATGMVSIL
jgi:hypothetical protein